MKECLRTSPSPWHTNYKESTWWRCVQCSVGYVLWCLKIQNQNVIFSWQVRREIFILVSYVVRLLIIVSLCWQLCVNEVDAASSGGWCQLVGEPEAGKQSLTPTTHQLWGAPPLHVCITRYSCHFYICITWIRVCIVGGDGCTSMCRWLITCRMVIRCL
jgi:hypothetical protein